MSNTDPKHDVATTEDVGTVQAEVKVHIHAKTIIAVLVSHRPQPWYFY